MATYYIAANGSTSNNGTSTLTPWPISKFTSFTFSAGDSILFRRGDTFNGTFAFTRSGSLGNNIILDAYGIGVNPAFDNTAAIAGPTFNFSNVSYITIRNIVIQNNIANRGILIYNGHDFNISNLYITNVSAGILAQLCTGNIVIDSNYMLNMQGPFPRGQCVQFNNVSGSGHRVTNNKLWNVQNASAPQDVINMFESNGTSLSPILIDSNWILGGGPSTSGSGIMTGDSGGSYQTASNNILVNPGQVGVAISGGTYQTLSGNKVFGAQFTWSNVGLYVWSQLGSASTLPKIAHATVSNNRVKWTNKNGSSNPIYLAAGETTPSGWSTNTWGDNTITAAILPNPLWTGTPWNTNNVPALVFPPISPVTYGAVDFSPGASGGTGTITYTSSNVAVATIVAGNIHVVGAGSTIITATSGTQSLTQTLTVNKTNLTIQADNQIIQQGDAIPSLTVSTTGFVNGDTLANLTVIPTISTTATQGSPVGTYPITVSGATSLNYNITQTNASLYITADGQTVVTMAGVRVIFA